MQASKSRKTQLHVRGPLHDQLRKIPHLLELKAWFRLPLAALNKYVARLNGVKTFGLSAFSLSILLTKS